MLLPSRVGADESRRGGACSGSPYGFRVLSSVNIDTRIGTAFPERLAEERINDYKDAIAVWTTEGVPLHSHPFRLPQPLLGN